MATIALEGRPDLFDETVGRRRRTRAGHQVPKGTSTCAASTGIAVVIGATCKGIPRSDAADVIAGYMVMTVVAGGSPRAGRRGVRGGHVRILRTERPLAGDEGRSGRSCRTCASRCASTAPCASNFAGEMRWSANRLVSDAVADDAASRRRHLHRRCGSRAAEPVVRVGDVVEGSVDGLGAIRNRVVLRRHTTGWRRTVGRAARTSLRRA